MRVGIIGAMEVEVELLRSELADAEAVAVAGTEYRTGRLGEKDVVVVRCGIGKVNAGVCVQALVDRFGVTHLVNTGVAGSLDDALDVGDLVVSTDCAMHDFDLTPLGYRPGEVPGMGVAFAADEGLRAAAVEAARAVAPEVGVREGRVVSGDQFVTEAAAKARLVGEFGGACCEMEGAAIAQAAWLNAVPFVVVRAISDKPGAEGQVVDYATFEREAAHRCARIVSHMVAHLA